MTQPTADELHAAWTECLYSENIPGARTETLNKLVELRKAKTTWVGDRETDLRLCLNAYLEYRGIKL